MNPFNFLSGTMPPHLMESYRICRSQSEAVIQKIAIVIESVIHLKAQRHRLLIYVKDPAAAREAHDMFHQNGLKLFNFCYPGHSRRERASGLAKFKNPRNSEFDALITPYQRGADGGNFYGACHHGVILAQQEARLTMELPEFHQSLSTDFTAPRIDERITGQHRLICAFEIVQQIQGTGFSKHPRARMNWDEMDMPEANIEGMFYAAVGRFLMANPTTTDKFTKEIMERIALRWEPGTELTMDRVVGLCPALPNGVKIYNCVKPGKGRDML